MAFNMKLFFSLVLLTWILTTTAATRPLAPKPTSTSTLAARLKLEGDEEGGWSSSSCWDSLFELQSCTGEVLMFFLNGETYLGPSCCDAISVIQHHCWPNMMGSLGFTAEEGDILLGYCNAKEDTRPISATPPPPPPTLPISATPPPPPPPHTFVIDTSQGSTP